MTYKLVARTIQCIADDDPSVKWDSKYIGVIDSDMPSQKAARVMWDAIALPFRVMCAAISGFSLHSVESGLEKIAQIERGEIIKSSTGNDAVAAIFDATKTIFWFEFGFSERYVDDGLGEEGGEITLAQFKLVLQIYFQFLRDPERKPIEVPFPE
ncbi:hypothetical protein SAMN05216350_11179 [Polaromonas sp. YR568]|uniref:hypothetical protein n=1 Tax=Polaromonas sp. YR568 TaxID=1855301 RepID=UPI0008F3E1D9|nr:hypothetical protein [Polaromonas sp. YR568]SFU99737.1 hypothetical protein SAMN05216350_11179 [Polaromonas sp. YR568]